MEKNNDRPKLRFPGFTDAWEQREFSDVFATLQNNSLSRAELNYEQGVAMNVHYGDVLIKFGEVLDISKEEIPYITDESFASKNPASFLHNGDVIIADAAEDETVGKCSEIAGLSNEIVVSGLHTIPCRPVQSFASGYLGYYINSRAFHDQLLPLIQGTKISSISKSALRDTDIIYPKSHAEQRAIGLFFINLDNLIALHQRKLNHLQDKKKSLLQKMFPKNGEDFPELRFPGFTDAWEQRKLGEVCRINGRIGFRGYTQKDIISKEEGGVLTFSPTNIVDNRLTLNVKNTYITRVKYEESPEIMIFDGDILFVKTGSTLGKSALVTGLEENASINPQIIVMRTEHEMKRLLSVILTSETIQAQVAAYKIGGAIPTLTETKIKEFEFYMPVNKKEKLQIGAFFKQLDNLITLHQRKLNHLQEQKKSLLQQMFI